ncbi:hypothetical protein BDV34DRAFT_231705 [Aspergillus parasiticus]|uniref:Uncharacterized protein n=1 Tax=Aspergillus parasiticus TaxID=5067 RepID=A0A5N6D1N2_ASPPA|nr:hypothetical protein BDV34DRAFT_231705 [Aspergillus parasiticus]
MPAHIKDPGNLYESKEDPLFSFLVEKDEEGRVLTIKPTLFFSSLREYLIMSLSPAQSEGLVFPFVLLWYNECTKKRYKGQDSIVES